MKILVTHTLPESSYQGWLKLASLARFFIQNKGGVSKQGTAVQHASKLLTYALVLIHDAPEDYAPLAANFNEEFDKICVVPVDPLLLPITVFYQVLEAQESPLTLDQFISVMIGISDMIAASFENKSKDQVQLDLIAEFERLDKRYESFQIARHLPPSQELH